MEFNYSFYPYVSRAVVGLHIRWIREFASVVNCNWDILPQIPTGGLVLAEALLGFPQKI